jgi:hypothetical protein
MDLSVLSMISGQTEHHSPPEEEDVAKHAMVDLMASADFVHTKGFGPSSDAARKSVAAAWNEFSLWCSQGLGCPGMGISNQRSS